VNGVKAHSKEEGQRNYSHPTRKKRPPTGEGGLRTQRTTSGVKTKVGGGSIQKKCFRSTKNKKTGKRRKKNIKKKKDEGGSSSQTTWRMVVDMARQKRVEKWGGKGEGVGRNKVPGGWTGGAAGTRGEKSEG